MAIVTFCVENVIQNHIYEWRLLKSPFINVIFWCLNLYDTEDFGYAYFRILRKIYDTAYLYD